MKEVCLETVSPASPRVEHGIRILTEALAECGYRAAAASRPLEWDTYRADDKPVIVVGSRSESRFFGELEARDVLLYHTGEPEGEGFYLTVCPGGLIAVVGGSDTGALYGCQELARCIRRRGSLPHDLAFGDAPRFALRGPAIGLQKTTVEPPRQTYEYPITPDRFPWFYDRGLWTDFLDMMLEERCNVVYIWSGHPFSSLVRLADYPEALEVTEEEYRLNVETFRWLTEEADRRGVRVVLKFYNIHIPLPFAEKHGLPLRQHKPQPLTADYYRKSLAEFVREFPNVGLMVCLGEALQGQIYGAEWFEDVIIPGVLAGLGDKDKAELPPIVLRSHAIEPETVIGRAIARYPNLYTEAKYNGESLTTWTPRGKWQKTHRHLASLDSIHIVNVHILANLEPFRYGSPSFIRKAMQAAKYRLGANGLHLYPLFFWDWPYAPDKAEPLLRQLDRDWIWFAAWFRYAWNPDRDPQGERAYWAERIGERFGGREAGEALLDLYDALGECAPKLLRRVGITEGNRQTMSLGMTMSQLTNPERHMPWPDLWESQSPAGERLEEYVVRELAGEPHAGETPVDMLKDVERHAREAAEAVDRARRLVRASREEFGRIAADAEAIRLMVRFYAEKIQAALLILQYKHTVKGRFFERNELLQEAADWLEKSVESYRELARLTEETYRFANSMQTPQRKVPFRDGLKYRHWTDCLPEYERELERFKLHVRELGEGRLPEALLRREEPIPPYEEAPFVLHSRGAETYKVGKGSRIFTDGNIHIVGCAEELEGLTGIRFGQTEAAKDGFVLDVEFDRPVRLLVGYFNANDEQWLKAPSLEENTHADDQGGYAPILRKGVKPYVYPSVNVHAFRYGAGRHLIDFGKGAYLVLGAVPESQPLRPREVSHKGDGVDTLDWLFE